MSNTPRAAVYIVVAMMLIGLIDTFVPSIAETAGLWQFHSVRASMTVPTLLAVAALFGWSLWPLNWRAVAARSLSSTVAMLIYFGCLAFLPIGQVAAGLFTSPIFVLILSVVVFRERVGPRRILAALLGFVGILVILDPLGAELSLVGAVPVIAGALYAVSVMITRHACADEHPATLLLAFFLCIGTAGILGALFLTWVGPVTERTGAAAFIVRPWVNDPGATFYWYTAVQAVGSLTAVGMLVRGYQIAVPSRVAPFENTLLVFAPLWALVLWGEALSVPVMIGMGLILVSGLILSRSQG